MFEHRAFHSGSVTPFASFIIFLTNRHFCIIRSALPIVRSSASNEQKHKPGYHTVGVTALTPEKKMPIPVYTKIFSAKENGFVGEDEETLNALEFLSLDLMQTIAVGYIGFISEKADEGIAVMQLVEQSKRIYGVNKFALYAIAYGLFVVFSKCKQGISDMLKKKQKSMQLFLFPDVGFGCC